MTRKDRLNDKFVADSTRLAHLRQSDPEMPEHVWQTLVRYTPRLPRTQWAPVRELTIANAVLMKYRTHESARRIMTMSGRFHAWMWTTTGRTGTAERLYNERNVYRYLQECMPEHSALHRWGVVRQLADIAEVLGCPPVAQLPYPEPNERRMFNEAEIAAMHSWAARLNTPLRRQNAWSILGLAGGAGLRTAEIADARIGDIESVAGRLFVNVPGSHTRRIPIMYPWSRTLLRSLDGRQHTPDAYVFQGFRLEEYRPRTIQTFLTDNPGQVRPTISRLRHHWLVTQINNNLPATVLMSIAGVSTAAGLTKHFVHAQPARIEDYLGLIIGEEITR